MASRRLLVALCVVALFAVRSGSHIPGDFTSGNASPDMASFFGAKPEAVLPKAPLNIMPATAKPEAASAIPTTTANTSAPPPRRSVSVAAGVAWGVAAVAVVGVAVAVAYMVGARRGGAPRESTAVQLGASP